MQIRWPLLAITALAPMALAQSPVGSVNGMTETPITGVGHDYIQQLSETVNPADGSVSISISAPLPKERGLNFPLNVYQYNTNGQFNLQTNFIPNTSTDVPYTSLLHAVGFVGTGHLGSGGSALVGATQDSGLPGTLTRNNISLTSPAQNGGVAHNCAYTSNYVYTDPSGGRHALPIAYMNSAYDNGSSCGFFGISVPAYTSGTDGEISGTIDPSTPGGAFIYDNHGNQLNLDYKVEDTNGNYLNSSGRSYAGSYTGNNTGVYPTSITIPDLGQAYSFTYPQVTSTPLTFSYAPMSAPSNDQYCPVMESAPTGDILEPGTVPAYMTEPGTGGDTVVILPNKLTYTMSYDPGNGLINEITYPTGATVSYMWTSNIKAASVTIGRGNSDNCTYEYNLPAVSKRTVTYNGAVAQVQNFSYLTTPGSTFGSWTSKTTTVNTTDMANPSHPVTKTVYTYTPLGPTYSPSSADGIGGGASIPVETSIAYFDPSGVLLRTVTKTWLNVNTMSGECITLPNNQMSGIFYQYSGSTNLVTHKAEYDFGTITSCQRPTSTATRETITAYKSFPLTPIHTYMQDRPSSVVVYDKGTRISESDYTYDDFVVSPVTAIGADSQYGSNVSTGRGNLTTVTQLCFTASGAQTCGNSITKYKYDQTGQIASVTDPNANVTSYIFNDCYGSTSCEEGPHGNTNIYPTAVSYPTTNGVAHTESYTYDFESGQMLYATDQNQQQTRYCYGVGGCGGSTNDPWMRLGEVEYPDLGNTIVTYSDAGPNPSTTQSTAMVGSTRETVKTTLDEYGHTIETQTLDGANPDTVIWSYDGLGRVATVTNPYQTTSDANYGVTTYTYDGLNRPVIQQQQDGTSTLQWCYDNKVVVNGKQKNCTANSSSLTSGTWVDYSDELQHHWQRVTDSLGRLTAVMEPDQYSNALAYETDYMYDALNNLKRVDQYGGGKTTSQYPERARVFSYDSLSRILTATNPETGSTCYGTVSGSTCQTNGYDANGNLQVVTDARGVATNYVYDSLNRLTSKSYTIPASLTSVPKTPTVSYSYDKPWPGDWGFPNQTSPVITNLAQTFLVGRLSTIVTGIAGQNSTNAWHVFGYDAMGRVSLKSECLPIDCGNNHHDLHYKYDLAGNLTFYDRGLDVDRNQGSPNSGFYYGGFNQTYDEAGHLLSVHGDTSGTNTVTDILDVTSHYATGDIKQSTRLGLYTSLRSISPRSWFTGEVVRNASNQVLWATSTAYGVNGTVTATTDTFGGSWTYSTDFLNRIYKANAPTGSEEYLIDPFGTRYGETLLSGSGVNPTPYQISTSNGIYGVGVTYDLPNDAGNMVNDGLGNALVYDAAGRLQSVTNANTGGAPICYVYDGMDDRVATTDCNGTVTKEFLYDMTHRLMTQINVATNTMDRANIFAGGEYIGEDSADSALSNTPTATMLRINDQVGSLRARLDGASHIVEQCKSFPYGEVPNCPTPSTGEAFFTGKDRDPESGYDYFGARYYASNLGRFLSPDPSGLFYANPSNPQSFNLYSYAQNNPLKNTDPTGLDCVYFNDAGDSAESIDHNSNSGECGQNGGDWVNGTTSASHINYNASNDTFNIQSSSTFHNYNSTASAPGSQASGIPCYGNCDTANGYSSSFKLPGFTVQLGLSGNLGVWGPLTGVGFMGLIVDSHGTTGTFRGGGGGLSAGTGASAGLQLGVSNGNDICAYGGPFGNTSATAGVGVGGTLDGFVGYGDGPGGLVSGGSITVGIAGGADASATITGTTVTPFGGTKCQ